MLKKIIGGKVREGFPEEVPFYLKSDGWIRVFEARSRGKNFQDKRNYISKF